MIFKQKSSIEIPLEGTVRVRKADVTSSAPRAPSRTPSLYRTVWMPDPWISLSVVFGIHEGPEQNPHKCQGTTVHTFPEGSPTDHSGICFSADTHRLVLQNTFTSMKKSQPANVKHCRNAWRERQSSCSCAIATQWVSKEGGEQNKIWNSTNATMAITVAAHTWTHEQFPHIFQVASWLSIFIPHSCQKQTKWFEKLVAYSLWKKRQSKEAETVCQVSHYLSIMPSCCTVRVWWKELNRRSPKSVSSH